MLVERRPLRWFGAALTGVIVGALASWGLQAHAAHQHKVASDLQDVVDSSAATTSRFARDLGGVRHVQVIDTLDALKGER